MVILVIFHRYVNVYRRVIPCFQALEEQRQMLEDQLELLARVPSCAASAKDGAGQWVISIVMGVPP